MSFLSSLQSKKNNLKPTLTVITNIDGRKFKETKGLSVEIGRSQYGYVVDTKPDDIPAQINHFLYLGSQDCCLETVLQKSNIMYVLSVGIAAPIKYPEVTYKFVPCLDLPEANLESKLRKCIPFIQQAKSQKKNILVHCNAGISRSASIVIGYLILVEGYSFVEASNIVKTARNCIKPNTGFERQLRGLSSSNRNF